MQIEIVTIGYEVLSGRTLDTNFSWLARALEEVSVQVSWHTSVGDEPKAIGEVLRRALDRADAVVVTGGLGPTPDDLTRKAVATALRRPLQLDETVLESIRERARRANRKLPASVETQALLPRGAQAWPNPVGSAPGLLIVHGGKPVILLPGVPQEMEALGTQFVVPYLRERTGRTVESFTLRTAGVYESMLHEAIGKMPSRWPATALAYLPSYSGVDLRVTTAGVDAEAVRSTAARARRELLERVASVVYGGAGDTMEGVVGQLMIEQKLHLRNRRLPAGRDAADTPRARRRRHLHGEVEHVAGKDRPAKPRALHAREPDVVAFTERDGAELRQRLAEEHPRKDGGSGKVAREVRLVRRHELHARRPDAELDVQDAVDERNAEPARADGAFGYELGARGPTPPWRPPAWRPPVACPCPAPGWDWRCGA